MLDKKLIFPSRTKLKSFYHLLRFPENIRSPGFFLAFVPRVSVAAVSQAAYAPFSYSQIPCMRCGWISNWPLTSRPLFRASCLHYTITLCTLAGSLFLSSGYTGEMLTRTLRVYLCLGWCKIYALTSPPTYRVVHSQPPGYLTQPVYFQPRKRMFHIRPNKNTKAPCTCIKRGVFSYRWRPSKAKSFFSSVKEFVLFGL